VTQKKIKDEKQKQEDIKRENLRREIEKARTDKSANVHQPDITVPSEFDIKRTYADICNEINSGNFTKARTIARAVSGANYKKYSFFLQGYIEYHADNRAAAETFFASAETLSPDFWPAFFYHGMVLRDMAKEDQAIVRFLKCKELLEKPEIKTLYDFTLDSFSPSYILSLCETFSDKARRR
jgi:chemotaxis protein methyltransferase CheR